jgi:DNA-binding transcriptional LysR family regulator
MEVSQLRVLRALGERGSIAAVAAAMRVTPSSVSQQISALQRRSPVPLTFKDGRRTALTDAGRALAAAAVDVEVALQRAEQAVASFQGRPSGSVSVAAFHSAGLAIFGPLVRALADPQQPDVRLSDFDVAQDAFAGLTTDHDLVVAHRLVGSPPWPRSVRVESLVVEPLDVVMRRDHRLAGSSSVGPGDLHDEEWVAVHEGFPLTQALAVISGIGGSDTRVRHRINELRVAASVVSASGCIALMPRYTSDLDDHPDLVLRPLADPGIGRHVDCLVRPETLERASVQTVLSHVRGIVSGLTAGPPGA